MSALAHLRAAAMLFNEALVALRFNPMAFFCEASAYRAALRHVDCAIALGVTQESTSFAEHALRFDRHSVTFSPDDVMGALDTGLLEAGTFMKIFVPLHHFVNVYGTPEVIFFLFFLCVLS